AQPAVHGGKPIGLFPLCRDAGSCWRLSRFFVGGADATNTRRAHSGAAGKTETGAQAKFSVARDAREPRSRLLATLLRGVSRPRCRADEPDLATDPARRTEHDRSRLQQDC